MTAWTGLQTEILLEKTAQQKFITKADDMLGPQEGCCQPQETTLEETTPEETTQEESVTKANDAFGSQEGYGRRDSSRGVSHLLPRLQEGCMEEA
jgi:hypothetical protein